MSKFNQELITKARSGEIAILNDGSVEELNQLLKEVKPKTDTHNGFFKYYVLGPSGYWCTYDDSFYVKAPIVHSVKDFFINSTNKEMGELKKYGLEWLEEKKDQPRTYKVARYQMKEIWEAAELKELMPLVKDIAAKFDPLENFGFVHESDISTMVAALQSVPNSFRAIFPEYFYIPEGEPVLVRDYDETDWHIRISDGEGGCYVNGGLKGLSITPKQIIPFTKNPPK